MLNMCDWNVTLNIVKRVNYLELYPSCVNGGLGNDLLELDEIILRKIIVLSLLGHCMVALVDPSLVL